MTPKETVAEFTDAIKQLEPIDRQPSDTNPTQIGEFVAPLLFQIQPDKMGGTQNLIGLIRPVAAYTTRYGAAFVKPERVGAYEGTIEDYATAVVHARTEAAHKAKRTDHGTYKTARRETEQFILAIVEDTWVWEIR